MMADFYIRFYIVVLSLTLSYGDLIVYPPPHPQFTSSDKFTVYVTQGVNRLNSFTYINTADHRVQDGVYVKPHRSVSWTSFAFSGSSVNVEVHTPKDFHTCIVRPKNYGYPCKRNGLKIAQFTVSSNTKLMSVEFDYDDGSNYGDIKDKLMIFADPLKSSAPNPNSPGVLYYPAGITDLRGQKRLDPSITEVYLAPGAYVHGGFITTGHHPVKIHGRGILSGERYRHKDSRFNYSLINVDTGSHHTIEGLVIVDPPEFYIRGLSDHNVVRNVKTLAPWTYNTDGVAVGDDGLVEDSFFMVNDDAIKLYNDRMLVRNCVVWQSQNGAVFQTGWWNARNMQHVRVSDVDIIHIDWCSFKRNHCSLSNNNAILDQTGNTKHIQASDVEFRNIRVEGNAPRLFYFILQPDATGLVSMFSFVNWTVESISNTLSRIQGSTFAHVNGWHFENFKIGGRCISNALEANLELDKPSVSMPTFHCPSSPAIGK